MNVLHIRQEDPVDDLYPIRLTLRRDGQPSLEAEAKIEFVLTAQEHEDLRWYLEDYLQRAITTETIVVQQVEALMKSRGEELYTKVLAANQRTQAIWFSIRNDLADLRIEIASGIAEAASIPWEMMRDPETDSPLSLRVKSFVRVQSDPSTAFVTVPQADDGQIRLLYIACRPGGANDVELRAVANRLLQDLGEERARFDIKALRPPTFEQLQIELVDAKEAGQPYHIVHFDGHGIYADLSKSKLADWTNALSTVTLGGARSGKHGYVIFEHQSDGKMRPVDGETLGQLLHDAGVPVLVLNACQTAMHEAMTGSAIDKGVHDEVRAIGSLAQGVVDAGVPAVLGMRYSVYVVTAAQYIGQLYAALAKGRDFGQAATAGRKHLYLNPERWIGLQPRPLQDWLVPIVYEAASLRLLDSDRAPSFGGAAQIDPVQKNRSLLRHVPEEGFIGRDETLFALDRAFDNHRVVLLHAYAGQGKSSTAVEFARWYSITGGLGEQPLVFLTSFERHTNVNDILNQIGQPFASALQAQDVHWSAINDPAERRQVVFSILRQVPILWIWDNVEPIAGFPEGTASQWTPDEQRDLRDFLQQLSLDPANKVKLLLTSRRDERKWLGGIPHRIAMPRMRSSDAARLALRLGQEKNIKSSEISDWQPLLEYCAGNPLTLRVLVGQAVKIGLRGRKAIADFVDAIRNGEQSIEDVDEQQGRDKSLGASLEYGFRHAFNEAELPIIALLHLFEATVHVATLEAMGEGEYSLPNLKDETAEHLIALLERGRDIGIITEIGEAHFAIHPALPWFLRQLFSKCYSEHQTSEAALYSWIVAIARMGEYLHSQFLNGNIDVISMLELEEANLLQARRVTLKNDFWSPLISCMQGLRALYEYQGRFTEWSALVEEIRPRYCTDDDEPVPGREAAYTMVMDYRVRLARQVEVDARKAEALQKKVVALDRERAAAILNLPFNVSLSAADRNRLRTLAVCIEALGHIQRENNDPRCIECYEEAINLFRRIDGKKEQATLEFNVGHAYLSTPGIRDLDAAEAAYGRSLGLRTPDDAVGRIGCIFQIGVIHYERFKAARNRDDLLEARSHGKAAETQFLEALELCPKDYLRNLATIHSGLGMLYAAFLQLDKAREQFELAAQCDERMGNHFGTAQIRFNIAVMYLAAGGRENNPAKQTDNLLRSRAYAEASLRDFQHYQGRAAEEEAKVKELLKDIDDILREP